LPRSAAPALRLGNGTRILSPVCARRQLLWPAYHADAWSARAGRHPETAWHYAASRLEADVGLRVNEVRMLDLDGVRWELGRFGKLNVRYGMGARRRGPKPRLVPL